MGVYDDGYVGLVSSLIAKAKKSVYVLQFKIDPWSMTKQCAVDVLCRSLVNKRQEGLDVRVLLDRLEPIKGTSAKNCTAARGLMKEGIDVRYLRCNRSCHAKCVIIDGRIGIVGSHNWSRNALTRNLEVSVLMEKEEGVKTFQDFFLRVFADALPFAK